MEKEIKKRGVQKGQKRGSYKKRNLIETEIKTGIEPEIKTEPMIETKPEPIIEPKIEPVIEPKINPDFVQTSDEEKLNSFFNEYKQEADETEIQTESINEPVKRDEKIKVLINGYMLLSLCDVVFPYGLVYLLGFFNPKYKKINPNKLKLEPEQKEALMASADEVAKYVFEKTNPLTVFVICLGLFYGTNLMNAINEDK